MPYALTAGLSTGTVWGLVFAVVFVAFMLVIHFRSPREPQLLAGSLEKYEPPQPAFGGEEGGGDGSEDIRAIASVEELLDMVKNAMEEDWFLTSNESTAFLEKAMEFRHGLTPENWADIWEMSAEDSELERVAETESDGLIEDSPDENDGASAGDR